MSLTAYDINLKIEKLKRTLQTRKMDYFLFGRTESDEEMDAKIHEEMNELFDELKVMKTKNEERVD